MKQQKVHRRGFVLLSVIVVLVVVGVILTRMASQGIQLTLAAKVRTDQLQDDWAVQSVERALLPHAGPILNQPRRENVPQPSRRFTSGIVQVGKRSVQITIADENAKLNVNRLYGIAKLGAADMALKQTVPPTNGITLRPRNAQLPIAWWGQLYDLQNASPELRSQFLANAASKLTLAGDGRLNYLRCDRQALDTVLRLSLNTQRASELADQLQSNPRTDINAVMLGQGVDEETRKKVGGLLTKVSTCFSLQTEILPAPGKSRTPTANFASIVVLVPSTMNNEADEPATWLQRRYFLR